MKTDSGQNSFVFYRDWARAWLKLPDEDLNDLIRALLSWQVGEEYQCKNPVIAAFSEQYISVFERDSKKYGERVQKMRDGAKARWAKKEAEASEDAAAGTVAKGSNGTHRVAMPANGTHRVAMPANGTHRVAMHNVNDTVTDTVNVNDNENVNVNDTVNVNGTVTVNDNENVNVNDTVNVNGTVTVNDNDNDNEKLSNKDNEKLSNKDNEKLSNKDNEKLSNKVSVIGNRKRFQPPTRDEVISYCKERKNNVDADRFIDYYQSNGWRVGKNPMKDWKAAVRTWERSDTERPKPRTEQKHEMSEEEYLASWGLTKEGFKI